LARRTQAPVPQFVWHHRKESSISASVRPQEASAERRQAGVELIRIRAASLSGWVAASGQAKRLHSPVAMSTGRADPMSSSTASTSSISVSIGGVSPGVNRSEQPRPRRSATISRPRPASSLKNFASAGFSQFTSTFEMLLCM
jgi:hypothetical protein